MQEPAEINSPLRMYMSHLNLSVLRKLAMTNFFQRRFLPYIDIFQNLPSSLQQLTAAGFECFYRPWNR